MYKPDLKVASSKVSSKSFTVFLKRARRFYFIASHCNKDSQKSCEIAPTFWEEISEKRWDQLLGSLKLKENWCNYMLSINCKFFDHDKEN